MNGLRPMVDNVLLCSLLVPCQSPRTTPILPFVKSHGEYRMVQDLRAIYNAVVPTHPLVANLFISPEP